MPNEPEANQNSSPNPPEPIKPSIYPNATNGRLQNTTLPAPDEQKIISANIDGSPEYEDFKQNVREAQSVKLEDNLFGRIVFFTIGLFALAFANKLYGNFLPIIGIIIKIVAAVFAACLVYYVVRQIQISRASRKYKQFRKEQDKTDKKS